MYNFLFVRITQITNLNDSNCNWLITSNDGKILEYSSQDILLSDLFKQNLIYKKLVFIIPDQLVSYHLAYIPIKDKTKRSQAAPYILEEKIVSTIEQTLFTVGPKVNEDHYIVCASDKVKVTSFLNNLKELYNLTPDILLTDALCLYNNSNNYKIYLNNDNKVALIISDNIIVTNFINLNLILEQLKLDNNQLSVDFFKHNTDNINGIIDISNLNFTINQEQEITEWLPFIISNWFTNKAYNKTNLAQGLIRKNELDVNFNKLWLKTVIIWVVIFFIFVGYKYFDFKIYTNRDQDLSNMIKANLATVNINKPDLTNAEKLIDRQTTNLLETLNKQKHNNEFIVLLASFAKDFKPSIKINSIGFKNHNLIIDLNVNNNDLKYLDTIRLNFAQQNINLIENILDHNQKTYKNIIWTLSLI